jgi:DNA polymerase-3 subunit alpha
MMKDFYNNNEDVRKIVDIAKAIEGVSRNVSQHACGVVIAKNPIADNIPEILLKDSNGNPTYTAAFQKDEVEENGCIKFDFLGLRNMSILKNASDDIGIDYQNIPMFDPDVYAYIATGDTEGIFQIESDGMQSLMKDMFADVKDKLRFCKDDQDRENLGKECFERLVAAVSLYRPGPIDAIPDYIAGMRDVNNIHYDTPELKPILKTTYGVICYQEQVQQICRALAGYSYGRADLIRRGMAKKKPEIIEHEKSIFLYGNKKDFDSGKDSAYVPGCIKNGIDEQAALTIWGKMEKFAEYA